MKSHKLSVSERLSFFGLTLDDLVDAIPDLSPRFQKILSRRFGLENEFSDGRVWSLREIASEFGVSASLIASVELFAIDEVLKRRIQILRRFDNLPDDVLSLNTLIKKIRKSRNEYVSIGHQNYEDIFRETLKEKKV